MLVALSISIVIGMLLGMIGAGGSIVTIPVFVYLLKEDALHSSVYSMFVVGICSLVGAILSASKKLVDTKAAILFGIPSLTGVYISRTIIFPAIPAIINIGFTSVSRSLVFMSALAIIMFFVAIKMIRSQPPQQFFTERKPTHVAVRFILPGLVTGIITGLLGIGGGFLIMPALFFGARLPIKTAIGTTLLIITANSLFAFLNSYSTVEINWLLLAEFSTGAVLGIVAGSMLAGQMKGLLLKKIFGYFVLSISIYVFYHELIAGILHL